MFELVGIDVTPFSESPHQCSGAMRQRAIIAMSLVLKPSLVIAHEPTTSLDVIVQDQIFKNFKNMQSKIGFSLLLVTHDIALVSENCEDIAVMYGGRIMEIGPIPAVINNTFHPYIMGRIRPQQAARLLMQPITSWNPLQDVSGRSRKP